MAIVNRSELKKAFEKGAIPSQEDFENLVDSMFHKQDDGLISQEDGLKLSPKGSARNLITFFNNQSDFKPRWGIEQYPKYNPEFGLNLVDQQGESRFFLQADGNIGIGTLNPTTKLQSPVDVVNSIKAAVPFEIFHPSKAIFEPTFLDPEIKILRCTRPNPDGPPVRTCQIWARPDAPWRIT